MTGNGIESFFIEAIRETKSGDLIWERITNNDSEYPSLDLLRSFVTHYNKGRIYLFRKVTDSTVTCLVKRYSGARFEEIDMDKEPLVLRLYNIVYSFFLNDFISAPSDRSATNADSTDNIETFYSPISRHAEYSNSVSPE